jgi:hypothetical protein
MFEHRAQPLLPRHLFLRRLGRQLGLGAILIACSLVLGTSGYHFLNGSPWIDSFVDAAMIMAGMGQVNPLGGTAGKLFAACYALYCGVVFILLAGLLLAPIFHRVLHRFHLELGAEDSGGGAAGRKTRK